MLTEETTRDLKITGGDKAFVRTVPHTLRPFVSSYLFYTTCFGLNGHHQVYNKTVDENCCSVVRVHITNRCIKPTSAVLIFLHHNKFVTNYRNEIFALLSPTCIVDTFGGFYMLRNGNIALIKCYHLSRELLWGEFKSGMIKVQFYNI
jgi:hypothetical protein